VDAKHPEVLGNPRQVEIHVIMPNCTFCTCMQFKVTFKTNKKNDATALMRGLCHNEGCDSLAGFRVVNGV
jgi:hypothetical protein